MVPVERIELPKKLVEYEKVLKTGDLLYVRNREGEISHVVIWVGEIGKTATGNALVLDSTSVTAKDAKGVAIPDGVYLREMRATSWYAKGASHALRVVGAKKKN
jgi:hypothetical protein